MALLALEKQVAISACLRACTVATAVFNNLVRGETLTKDDKSPVTVADLCGQAVINAILAKAFPDDPIVGEEDSKDLRAQTPQAEQLRTRLTQLANGALQKPLQPGELAEWGIGPETKAYTTTELLDLIDRGNHAGGDKGRMWVLDPIDGTKGFLRGGQFAICVALIEDAEVKVGVLGCPNLPLKSFDDNEGERGTLFVAVKGQGAEQRPLNDLSQSTPLSLPPARTNSSAFAILESLEGAHSSHSASETLSKLLGITSPPLRMDSQAKYGCLARGEGGLFFRTPIKGKGYQEKIWDHAAGSLIIQEAGGIVSDKLGRPLNFGLGRTLGENFGIVATFKEELKGVVEAIQACPEE